MIKAVIAQFSAFFAMILLIAGLLMLYKRVKDADSIIDKDDVLQELVGFLVFFGILLLIMFV